MFSVGESSGIQAGQSSTASITLLPQSSSTTVSLKKTESIDGAFPDVQVASIMDIMAPPYPKNLI